MFGKGTALPLEETDERLDRRLDAVPTIIPYLAYQRMNYLMQKGILPPRDFIVNTPHEAVILTPLTCPIEEVASWFEGQIYGPRGKPLILEIGKDKKPKLTVDLYIGSVKEKITTRTRFY